MSTITFICVAMKQNTHNMRLILLSLLLLISSNTNAEDWKTTDKVLMGSLITLHVIDMVQTKKALSEGYKETNPLYGRSPSDEKLFVVKLAATTATYYLADTYPEARRAILVVTNAIQFITVRHNYFIVGFGFGF